MRIRCACHIVSGVYEWSAKTLQPAYHTRCDIRIWLGAIEQCIKGFRDNGSDDIVRNLDAVHCWRWYVQGACPLESDGKEVNYIFSYLVNSVLLHSNWECPPTIKWEDPLICSEYERYNCQDSLPLAYLLHDHVSGSNGVRSIRVRFQDSRYCNTRELSDIH
jgi:hypothetical protein